MNPLEVTEAILALQPDDEVWRFSATAATTNQSTFDANITWEGGVVKCNYSQLDANAAKRLVGLQQLRERRNELLAEIDWWGRSDVTMTSDQTAYCKALRDLPATVGDDILNWPNITWPTKP